MAAGFSGSSSPRCDFLQKNALRSLALLLLLLTLVVVAEIGLTHRNAYEATQAHERDRVQHDLADMRLTVSGYLEKLTRDAQLMSRSTVLGLYLSDPTPENTTHTEKALQTLSMLRGDYDQTRYIDQNGQEKIRVDRENGQSVLHRQGLQNKSDRGYVQTGLQLGAGQVLVSELDLNVEQGVIEEPHRPTLRAVAPVFLDGSRRGLMVLNIAADELLASLRVNLPAGSDLVMLNATGGWITGGGALDWQFMLDPSARLSAQDPALWASIEGQHSGSFERLGECYHYEWFQTTGDGVQAPKWLLAQRRANEPCAAAAAEATQIAAKRIAITLLIALPLAVLWHQSRVRSRRFQQALQDQQAELSMIAQEAGHGMIMVDRQCHVLWMNREAERLLGWSEAELVGKNLHETIHLTPEGQPVHAGLCPTLNALETGERHGTDRDLMVGRNGQQWVFSTRVTPFGPAENRKAVVAFADVSTHVALQQELAVQAQTDVLTGTLNRRSIVQNLQAALDDPTQTPCVLALDIDFFKKVNDTHGHQTGDQVLIHFCRTIETMLRKGDLLGRMGGEEFLVVANTLSLADAMGLAERIRAAIASTPCLCSPDTPIAITTSVGVAQPHVGETMEQLLERADEALYRAKHAGRNRVMMAGAAIA